MTAVAREMPSCCFCHPEITLRAPNNIGLAVTDGHGASKHWPPREVAILPERPTSLSPSQATYGCWASPARI